MYFLQINSYMQVNVCDSAIWSMKENRTVWIPSLSFSLSVCVCVFPTAVLGVRLREKADSLALSSVPSTWQPGRATWHAPPYAHKRAKQWQRDRERATRDRRRVRKLQKKRQTVKDRVQQMYSPMRATRATSFSDNRSTRSALKPPNSHLLCGITAENNGNSSRYYFLLHGDLKYFWRFCLATDKLASHIVRCSLILHINELIYKIVITLGLTLCLALKPKVNCFYERLHLLQMS